MSWLSLLNKAVLAEGSQAAVARKLSVSPSRLSLVINNNYSGNITAIKDKVLEIYGGKTVTDQQIIPDGYKKNSIGHLVPITDIPEIDLERDDFVRSAVQKGVEMNDRLKMLKKTVADDMQAFLELSVEKYQVDVGGSKSYLELVSFDGKYKLVREYSDRYYFNEKIHAAKALIDESFEAFGENAGPELREIVNKFFKVNRKGKINVQQVRSLRQHKFDNPLWRQAMDIVDEATMVDETCTYYRMYERDEHGNYRQIALDLAAV